MKIKVFQLCLLMGCLLAIVEGLFHQKIYGDEVNESKIIANFAAIGASEVSVAGLRDVRAFKVSVPNCPNDGLLLIGGFAANSGLRGIATKFHGSVQYFFSGTEIPNFETKTLWKVYFRHQILAKLGFTANNTWDQNLILWTVDDHSCAQQRLKLNEKGNPTFSR